MNNNSQDSKKLWLSIKSDFEKNKVQLGTVTSQDYITDPKRMAFVASRYKFCAKMLEGFETVIEIGCGDAFGAPIVADAVNNLICTDIDDDEIALNKQRNSVFENISFQYSDFREGNFEKQVDGIFLVDVIEHIYSNEEHMFMSNIAKSLNKYGVALIGTPNVTSEQYASERSRAGHVNLKSADELRTMCSQHFSNVFMFGMNDEVLHTGFAPMAHYLWALCVGPKSP